MPHTWIPGKSGRWLLGATELQYNLLTGDSDFDTRHLLVAPLNVDAPRYTVGSAWTFNRNVAQRVRVLTGVQSVCYASPPFSPFWGWTS
jgi:hypothetical protein